MWSVGIDAHYKEHQVEMQKENGERILKKKVGNNRSGLEELCRQLDNIKKSQGDTNPIGIFAEAVGSYFGPFKYHLSQRGYRVVLINPIKVKSARMMKNLGKTKNDRIDAATLASLPWMDANYREKDSHQRYGISNLTRLHQKMQEHESRLILYLRADLNLIFPEILHIVSDVDTKTFLAVLEKYPTPAMLLDSPIDELKDFIIKKSNKRFNIEYVNRIRELAKNTIGVPDDDGIYAYRIRFHISRIYEAKDCIKELEQEIEKRTDYNEDVKMIDEIRGINRVRAASIYGEIGSISQFETARKLQGYGGITPRIKQSANKEWIGRPTKLANHYLRRNVSISARSISAHSEEFRAVYFRERTKGKSDTQAFIIVGNRLLYHVFSILKNKKPYLKRMPQELQIHTRPIVSRR